MNTLSDNLVVMQTSMLASVILVDRKNGLNEDLI